MPNPFLIVPKDPSNPSSGYKFATMKSGTSVGFAGAKNPLQLASPILSLSGNMLTINNVAHATNYKIYQNNSFLVNLRANNGDTTTLDLATLVYPVANGTIKVVAVDRLEQWKNSAPSALAQPFPSQKADTPTAEQIQIDGNLVVIDTPSDYIRVTLVGEDTAYKDFSAGAPIDLKNIVNVSTSTLPDGYYEIYIQYGEDGKALSDPYAAGSYRRLVVALDDVAGNWFQCSKFTIVNDGGR